MPVERVARLWTPACRIVETYAAHTGMWLPGDAASSISREQKTYVLLPV